MSTAEFTDFQTDGSIIPPIGSRSAKRRGLNTSRLRLSPIDSNASSAGKYEIPSNAYKLKRITQKRELLEAVRKANSTIATLGKEALSASSLSTSAPANSPSRQELTETDSDDSAIKDVNCLEEGVRQNAKLYNDCKLLVQRRQKQLNAIMDEVYVLQNELNELKRIQNQETPTSQACIKIKESITGCTESMEDQMHLRRQLEHMVRRLQTSQLKTDSQLQSIAKTVNSSIREQEDVRLLCRELEAGKSRAIQTLQDIQLQFQLDRKTRARELGDHEIRAKNAQKMEQWRLQRIQERSDMLAELRGEISAEGEAKLLNRIQSREREAETLNQANQTTAHKIEQYEEWFLRLKVVMGVTDLSEVLQKIDAQLLTSSSLDTEKVLAENRLQAIRKAKVDTNDSLNELKSSGGVNSNELNREASESLGIEITEAKATLALNKAALERLESVIMDIQQGAFGLMRRLQVFDKALGFDSLETHSGSSAIVSIDSSSDILKRRKEPNINNVDTFAAAEKKLTKMLEIIEEHRNPANGFSAIRHSDAEKAVDADISSHPTTSPSSSTWSPRTNSDPHLHVNNIRVKPGSVRKNRLQKGHQYIVDNSQLSDHVENQNELLGSTEIEAQTIPSRDILKMSSARHYAEVMRRKELTEKQKLAAEKGISDEEMVLKIRKKMQLDSDTRLATSPTQTYNLLPRSTSKENSQQTIAFVTQLNFNDL